MTMTTSPTGSTRRVLLVEDDFLQADSMRRDLEELGISVIGPVSTVASAMQRLASNGPLEGAVLDLNLGGEWCFPLAARLSGRGVPFVFWTGYSSLELPREFEAIPLVSKPADGRELVRALFQPVAPDTGEAFADVFVQSDGTYLLTIRGYHRGASDPSLTWVGATLLDRREWSRTLRLRLVDGVFYRVPPRYLGTLKRQLSIVG